MTPIKEYLINDTLPSDPLEAKRLKYRAIRYSVLSGELYKRRYSRVYKGVLDPQKRKESSRTCIAEAVGTTLEAST